MSFIRRQENFICEFCNTPNVGDGYTNHCNICLYSKHVDIYPGDRLETCQGLMKPVYVSYVKKQDYIEHECLICGFKKKNKIQKNDSLDAMIAVQKNI
jgi:hypothetical protein